MTVEISKIELMYFQNKIIGWGSENFRSFTWRYSNNKWHCLVAEIMLQRTRAEQVEPIYKELVAKYEKPQDWLNNPDMHTFTSLGLPDRANQFLKLNKIIAINELPATKVDLMKLPGVGEYIASAFLSLHLGKRAFLIDSNIVRVYGRFFGFNTDGETRRKKWFNELADRLTPTKNHRNYNYAIIDFSREVCKPRPLCNLCPVKRKCKFFATTI